MLCEGNIPNLHVPAAMVSTESPPWGCNTIVVFFSICSVMQIQFFDIFGEFGMIFLANHWVVQSTGTGI